MDLPKLAQLARIKRLIDRHLGQPEQAERWAAWAESAQRVPRPQTRAVLKVDVEVNT